MAHTAVVAGLTVAAIYLVVAWFTGGLATPPLAYWDELAEAFAKGQLCLVEPSSTHDLTHFKGRWYVPFPPLPAMLLAPWVALFGKAGTSTVIFSALLGAVAAALLAALARSLVVPGWERDRGDGPLWLTALLAFGTVQFSVAFSGTVWHVAHMCAVACVALAALLAARRVSPWLWGGALALAILARPHVVLSWPLLAGLSAVDVRADARRWALLVVRSLVPVAGSACLLAAYNVARFADPLDFGYRTASVNPRLQEDLASRGQFSSRYLDRNLSTMLLAGPRWDDRRGQVVPDPNGMSIFITTPAFLLLACAVRPARHSPAVRGAWFSAIAIGTVLSLYYNTGWAQFGYRFSLDLIVPLLVLVAVGSACVRPWLFRSLVLLSVAVNLWGVLWWFDVV